MKHDDEYTPKEAARRAKKAIERMFSMPHKSQSDLKGAPGPRGEAQRRRRARARQAS